MSKLHGADSSERPPPSLSHQGGWHPGGGRGSQGKGTWPETGSQRLGKGLIDSSTTALSC